MKLFLQPRVWKVCDLDARRSGFGVSSLRMGGVGAVLGGETRPNTNQRRREKDMLGFEPLRQSENDNPACCQRRTLDFRVNEVRFGPHGNRAGDCLVPHLRHGGVAMQSSRKLNTL